MKLRALLWVGLLLGHHAVGAEVFAPMDTQRQMDVLSHTLQQYTDADAQTRYQAYKAKMWLSYAMNQQSEHSSTGAGQEALQQAQIIVNGLQAKQPLTLTTPILSMSQVMRRDLWWQIEALKQQGAIDKNPESLAHAEVMLVWAAAAYCELGWRHAKAHFNAAEQALYQVAESTGLHKMAIASNPAQLPSLQQLNGTGCHGVNAEFWPLTSSAYVSSKNTANSVVDQTHLKLVKNEGELK